MGLFTESWAAFAVRQAVSATLGADDHRRERGHTMRRAALLPARFDVTDAYTDTDLCGFEVAIVSTQRGTDTVFPVDSGGPWHEVIHATTRATLTSPATGRTLVQKGGASLFIDGDEGTFTFDWDGNVFVLHGPHPLITDGDATVAAICTHLAAA
jgi:hypothetical protein